ncbi:MAG: hypothetical protein QOD33_1216 [Pyrinomonadaceae bacterium]|nr:hypothetical protein [Pyrinomonadaceae bacterium]
MKLFWLIVAGVCIVVAAVFLLRNDLNTAFVIATLGMVAWLLNYRAQMKDVIAAAELQEDNEGDEVFEDAND